jgi:stress-induced morphogen
MAKGTKKPGKDVQRILDTLQEHYKPEHPKAKIEAYRYNPASIRIRIIDPDFARKDLVERENMVWPLLEGLPEEIRADIIFLLLLTPKESKTSFGSMEFDHPTPAPRL